MIADPTTKKAESVRLAHLILAHGQPAQLDRLISRLQHPNSWIYIHIDAKVSLQSFSFLEKKYPNCTLILQRYSITWGGYSMVHSTLRCMEFIKKDRSVDFIQLMSGADYPLKALEDFHHMLSQHMGKSFMEIVDEKSNWVKESRVKTGYYHFVDFKIPGKYWVQWVFNFLTRRRTFPASLVFKGRSQWMTLSMKHVDYVLEYEKSNPKIIRYFKYTWGADEFFFQSILHSSPYKDELINNNWNFILWIKGKSSPEILTFEDFPKMEQHSAYFGRKFDPQLSASLMDHLDQLSQAKNS
jgi:hypothetical protein